ncbi:MAG: hypothetical protein ABJM06_04180 [Gilvibacter sp.]
MSTLQQLGTVILGNSTKDTFQNVYSSQSYGTFFGISGEFKYNSAKNSIESIKLSIQNYKGILNLAFAAIPVATKKTLHVSGYPQVQVRDYIEVNFKIRYAHEQNPDYDIDVDVSNILGENLQNGQLISMKRELVSFYDKSADDLLQMEAQTQNSSKIEMYYQGVFDSEFFYRNGQLWKLKEDGDFSVKDVSLSNSTDDTPSCKQRHSQIFII